MTNYVSIHGSKMLVLRYHPQTHVVESDVATHCLRAACAMLTEETGIIHVPADRDQVAWTRTIHQNVWKQHQDVAR